MHWKNLGFDMEANSSCWKFEIRNNRMRWNALRVREDGTFSVFYDILHLHAVVFEGRDGTASADGLLHQVLHVFRLE